MARSVRLRKTKPATKIPVKAIAVAGFLKSGIKGLTALRKTPKPMLMK
jgi:hypothetical protein